MSTAESMLVGEFRLEAPIARGGMGEIWRACDLRSGERVAIKRLLLDRAADPSGQGRARLLREIQALERLRHDNIVRCLGSGFDGDGQPYLVLEWLEGEDLADRQRRAPLRLNEILDIVVEALRGLGACHELGVVHRDVKPGNLFLVRTASGIRVKVVDFGLARLGGDATRMTAAGQVMGTLAYMSPEQARGLEQVDHRADLYAMGVVLYELCTGRLPFNADQAVAVLLKIVTETPPRPRQIRPDLPEWLEAAIWRAMERAPSDRFASAAAMVEALRPPGVAAVSAATRPLLEPTPTGSGSTIATTSLECRLVCLLCVQPVEPGADLLVPLARAVEESGGVLHRLLGGQAVALYGLERTVGDEARRALQDGLAVRDALGRRVRLLVATVRVDVDQGLRLHGQDLDATLSKLGALPPGEVMLDGPTRQLVRDQVELKRIGSLDALVGFATTAPLRRRVLGVETPILGRETELAVLRAAFYRAIENQEPEAVLVLGPAGIGKSRLCEELRPEQRARAALFLEAGAESSRRRTPFGLVARAMARAAGIHVGQEPSERRAALEALVGRLLPAEDAERVAPFVGEAMEVPFPESAALRVARADPKLMREQVAASFARLIEAAGQQSAVVMCLEDLHWADEESLFLCQEILERVDRAAVFILGTAHPEVLERHPQLFAGAEASRLELRALGRRPLRRLVRTILGQKISRDLEELILRWSEGNPYFAEELVCWLASREALVLAEAGWQLRVDPAALELPVGVEGAVQARLDRLPPDLKELLKAASVFGEVCWDAGCQALGFPWAAQGLLGLESAELVLRRPDSRIAGAGEWAFRSALLRQVAYHLLPADRCRLLHLEAARWLEATGETDGALLAHHFQLGGDRQRAAECLVRAGARALADGNPERAVDCYRASIIDGLPSMEIALRNMGLARSLILLGRYDEAWRALQALPGLADGDAGGAPWEAEVLLLKARIQLGRGSFAPGEAMLEEAAALLEGAPASGLLFDIRHTLFWLVWVQGRYADASAIAGLLFEAAEQDHQPEHQCVAKLAVACSQLMSNDPCGALEQTEQALAHAREIGDRYREVDALVLLGTAQEVLGCYDQAIASWRSAQQLVVRLKTVHHQANTEGCLGRVCLTLGRLGEASDHFRIALEKAEMLGDSRMLAVALVGAARAACSLGDDLVEAERLGRRALELAQGRSPEVMAEAHLALALIGLARAQWSTSVEHALQAVTLLDQLGGQVQCEIEILLAAHDALQAVGRSAEATAMLRRADDQLQRRAAKVADPALRQSFLARVPSNVRVRELCSAASG